MLFEPQGKILVLFEQEFERANEYFVLVRTAIADVLVERRVGFSVEFKLQLGGLSFVIGLDDRHASHLLSDGFQENLGGLEARLSSVFLRDRTGATSGARGLHAERASGVAPVLSPF